ncbi:sigma-70 family RNA polymerase sigma factor [Gemmata sp.]|uniref:sigma-70 family RNA polymerase sigma factor n=1 Tax=Gemmata sp. TaxID=1914242 RepID=UPI003F72888C
MNPTPTTPDPVTDRDPAALAERYTPLAMKMARRRGAVYPWLADDFASDAMLSLWRAASGWQAERAKVIKFPTFVILCVRRLLNQRIAQERRQNPTAFGSRTVQADDGAEVPLVDLAADRRHPDPADAAEWADEVERLDGLLGTLSPERRALVTRYVCDDTAGEIAAETGVTAQAVRDTVYRSLRALRTAAG